jgi:uncharacterized membrane protein
MTIRDTLTPLNIVLVVLIVAATVAGFFLIAPGTMLPVHWGVTGEADRFLPRDAALLILPGIALGVGALLAGVHAFTSAGREGARHAIAAIIPALLALFLAIQVATVMIGVGIVVDMVRVVVLAVGALLVVLGNIMPKTQPNGFAGIRLRWTMRDPANWQATNRVGGVLFMLGGLVMIAAALVTGNAVALLLVTATGVVLPVVVTTLYSFRLSQRI